MSLPPKIMTALNVYDSALRNAVRKDVIAERQEIFDPAKLRALEQAWYDCKAKRVELEAVILEALRE
jgi:hypothetical protein